MIWVAIAFVLSGLVALASLVGFHSCHSSHVIFGPKGPFDCDFFLLDRAAQWNVLRTNALVQWSMLTSVYGLPALALALGGQLLGLRSTVAYAAGGAFALGIIPLIADYRLAEFFPGASYSPAKAGLEVLIFGSAGMLAGCVYWLLAGRFRIQERLY